MSEDRTIFDDILDQLAQGATYAARDDSGDLLLDARDDITDGIDDSNRLRKSVVRNAPSISRRHVFRGLESRPSSGSRLLLPRPGTLVRIFTLAAVVLMAMMTALAAIFAQSVHNMSLVVREDERFKGEELFQDQRFDADALLDREKFEGLLQDWAQHRQQLLLKRFRVLAEHARWREAAKTYKAALSEDAFGLQAGDHLLYGEVLIEIREIERAQETLASIDVRQLDEGQRQRMTGMITRLQWARMQRN